MTHLVPRFRPNQPTRTPAPSVRGLLAGRLPATLVAICGALALLYLGLAAAIAADDGHGIDVAVSETLHGWSSTAMDWFMGNVTHLGDSITTNILTVVTGLWLWRRGRLLVALAIIAATPAGQLLVELLKGSSARERPDVFVPLDRAGGYSFPSGHVFAATLAWGLLAGIVSARLAGAARWLPWLAWAVIVGCVGASRIYLGVHYASDVLASLLVGTAWIVGWLAVIGRINTLSRTRHTAATTS